MGSQNFLTCDRDQPMLLPPDLHDWLDEDHLAWFVIEAIEELDLEPFYASYRADGHGRAAQTRRCGDPAHLRLRGRRALLARDRAPLPRGRRLPGDLRQPGPRSRHGRPFPGPPQEALADLFGQVLALCAEAGLVEVGVIAVDGSKFAAAASDSAIRPMSRSPPRSSKKQDTSTSPRTRSTAKPGDELPVHLARGEGRRAWLREAKKRLDTERAEREDPVPRAREERLELCHRRLVEDWRRAPGKPRLRGLPRRWSEKDGRPFGAPPKPYEPPAQPEGKVNTTDPDAKRMKFGRNFLPAYNAQAVTTEGQIIVAAEITTEGVDFEQLDPMISAAERELQGAGVPEHPGVVLADAGYWSNGHIDAPRARHDPDRRPRHHSQPAHERHASAGLYDFMRRCSPPSPVVVSTHKDSGWSSRSSLRSRQTGGSSASNEEAGQPQARNGA